MTYIHTKKLIVGLTGGIASGKSTISKVFERHGIPNVDADIVARDVVQPNTIGLSKIKNTFGLSFIKNDGTLDRVALGTLVFADHKAMSTLNTIMSPLIQENLVIEYGLT